MQLDQFSLKLFGVKKLNNNLEMDPSKIILDLALAVVSVISFKIYKYSPDFSAKCKPFFIRFHFAINSADFLADMMCDLVYNYHFFRVAEFSAKFEPKLIRFHFAINSADFLADMMCDLVYNYHFFRVAEFSAKFEPK